MTTVKGVDERGRDWISGVDVREFCLSEGCNDSIRACKVN